MPTRFVSYDWQRIGIAVGFIVLLFLLGLAYYILYVPSETRVVAGTVVSVETIANNSQPNVRHYLHVRLDSGLTVRARIDPHVPLKIGRRVNLIANTMPILGIEWFRFKGVLDTPSKHES